MKQHETKFIVIDLFCGFGGTTTGFMQTNGKAKVIACINHDPKAIKSHWMNHPEVVHFEEDIRILKLEPVLTLLDEWRSKLPDAKVILWASLECTNFSKAKGGQPRNADSRTLAEHLERYIITLRPDYIQIENVVEFMAWGPLDDNGKPISRRNGEDWLRWRGMINRMGYYDEWKEMNSANYGAYTSRNRLFGIFAKHHLPIAFPIPTHAKKIEKANLFSNLLKWKAVKEVLHLHMEGESIFTRKKPLSEKTLQRIYAGLIKFVAGGKDAFIAKYYSGRPMGKVISLDGPAGTIKTADGQALVQSKFMLNYQHSSQCNDINEPHPTLTCKDKYGLVNANFILKYNSTNPKTMNVSPGHTIEEPAPVISCQGRLGLIKTKWLNGYYGNATHADINGPCPTISTHDRFAKVHVDQFINNQMGKSIGRNIEEPANTIPTTPKLNLVTANKFIMPTGFDNQPKSLEELLGTITANRKHHYIVNPSHGGHPSGVDGPCPVIIARQDKAPLYLVDATTGDIEIQIYDEDSECMRQIKEFMASYGIIDIKMRMLNVKELLCIQGFPEDYKMFGTQTDAKKFIGNSVVPHVVKAWTERMAEVV